MSRLIISQLNANTSEANPEGRGWCYHFLLEGDECGKISLTLSRLGFRLWKGRPIHCLPLLLGCRLSRVSAKNLQNPPGPSP